MAEIRIIDLFSGCGGLSLGFELFDGDVSYKTVLAIDNHAPTVRCFNKNHPVAADSWPIGRSCDLTWFSNSSEFLLFYLLHLAKSQPDEQLAKALSAPAIGVGKFLQQLKEIDENYAASQVELLGSSSFTTDLAAIDSGVNTTAVCKGFFTRLGLSLPRKASASPSVPQIWSEEYTKECITNRNGKKANPLDVPQQLASDIRDELTRSWDANLLELEVSCNGNARGKNVAVIQRLKTLVTFLKSKSGELVKDSWLNWRTDRDSLRVYFCSAKNERLEKLYNAGRSIHLVLGGPPCKGFSRIGRPVASSLTAQGTYSWASCQFVDQRNALMYQYVMVLQALKPSAFLFENVENFKSPLKRKNANEFDPAYELKEAIDELANHNLHFHVKSGLVTASEHGVPQKRIRFIMAGINSTAVDDVCLKEFLTPTDENETVPLGVALAGLDSPREFVFGGENNAKVSDSVNAYTLVDPRMPDSHRQFVNWIRQPARGRRSQPKTVDAHVVRQLRPDDLALIKKFGPGQRWMDYASRRSSTLGQLQSVVSQIKAFQRLHESNELPLLAELESLGQKLDENFLLRLLIECSSPDADFERENHLLTGGYLSRGNTGGKSRHGDWFERMDANRPSKTIVAHIGKDTYGYFHPFEPRAISIREAARIQTFPDFFQFGGEGVVEAYSMIGNAVPPLLSHYFASRLSQLHVKYGVFSGKKRNGTPIKRMRLRKQKVLFVDS